MNRFAYVGGNPVSYIDPLGLELVPVTLPGLGSTMLDSAFARKVNVFVKVAEGFGVTPDFESAYRTPTEQKNVKGAVVKPADNSLHSAGFAIDVKFLTQSRQTRAILRQAAKEAGLSWGGLFSDPDPVHFYDDPFPPGSAGRNFDNARKELIRDATEQYSRRKRKSSCP